MKKIELLPRINKCNGQINFQLKKTSLPKKIRSKLPKLKAVKIKLDNFEFEEW